MEELERYRLIEEYLDGSISDSDRISFEKELQNNPDFQQEVDLVKISNDVVFENRLFEIKNKINADFKNGNTESRSWNKYVFGFIAISAIAISSYYYSTQSNPKTNIKESKSTEKVVQHLTSPTVEQPTITTPSSTKEKAQSITNTNADNSGKIDNNTLPKNNVLENPIYKTDTIIKPGVQKTSLIKKDTIRTITTPIIDLCNNTKITAQFTTATSCKGSSTGVIQILLSTIKGGKKPYSYSINGSAYAMENRFNELSTGIYTIKIKDQNNCTQTFQETIKEVTCIVPLDDYSFNPDRGQTWVYNNNTSLSATIQIIEKTGVVVKTFTVQPNQKIEWNGLSNYGERLEMGGYVCMITFENGTIEKGMILIYQ
jgi:hypothetical protein